jgi:hypothetical protein
MAAKQLNRFAAFMVALLWVGTVGASDPGRVAALQNIVVNEAIRGDVVTVGGDIELMPGAVVDGHAVAILGRVVRHPGAQVSGRALSVNSVASLTLYAGEQDQTPYVSVGLRMLGFGGWLVAATLLAWLFPYRLRHGSWLLGHLGLRVVILGATAFVTLIAALVAMLGLGPRIGVPLAAVVFLVFLAAKAVGLTVLGARFGSLCLERVCRRHVPLTTSVFLGVLLLLGLRLIPVIGGFAWTVLSIAALGAGVFALALVPNGESAHVTVRPSNSSPR